MDSLYRDTLTLVNILLPVSAVTRAGGRTGYPLSRRLGASDASAERGSADKGDPMLTAEHTRLRARARLAEYGRPAALARPASVPSPLQNSVTGMGWAYPRSVAR